MSKPTGTASKRRRSRYRFNDLPDLMRTNSSLQLATEAVPDARQCTTSGTTSQDPVSAEELEGLASAPVDTFEDNRGECLVDQGTETPTYSIYDLAPDRGWSTLYNWRVLWGLIATNGTTKLTRHQYQSFRTLLDVIAGVNGTPSTDNGLYSDSTPGAGFLPHYTTLHRKYRPILFDSILPPLVEVRANLDLSRSGICPESLSSTGIPHCQVPIILPSEYACMDMATEPVWAQILSTSLTAPQISENTPGTPSHSTSECVDTWPLIAARRWFYGHRCALNIDTESTQMGLSSFAEIGDVVSVSVLDAQEGLSENVQRSFGYFCGADQYKAVKGTILCSWFVHHPKRRHDPLFVDGDMPNLSDRDKTIVDLLGFVSYVSPTDSVDITIPELPVQDPEHGEVFDEFSVLSSSSKKQHVSPEIAEAMKARRSALRRRRAQMEAAWCDWEKPILKPGDTVVLLRPCVPEDWCESNTAAASPSIMLTSTDKASRICIVSRFWVEHGERNRHIFFIPGGADLSPMHLGDTQGDGNLRAVCSPLTVASSAKLILDVQQISLLAAHSGLRGYESSIPVSSIGTLSTGEEYFVYRFILYWDGFELHSGKSACGEGFYMVCLNLPLPARSSPNAIRVISLTPPGVKGEIVLLKVLDDIERGMTTGFVDYDAHGRRRRVFLDLVGILGDTPALNHYLDVLGHTASACCHLCRFVRGSTTLVGSRYSKDSANGMQSHSMRGFFQHCAIRDSGATSETTRLLGMNSTLSPSSGTLIAFRNAMFNAKTQIPTTSTGYPVVPHHFDPYRGCFVAPDHLLTGHLRDCISLALKLLPSRRYRETCENFMLGVLKDAKLPVQNRLVDHDKKALYAMSMTELYALSIVVEPALVIGCAYEQRASTGHRGAVTDKCRQAISLVASCADLISELCYFPSRAVDGFPAVQSFESGKGAMRIARLQRMTEYHLKKLTQICLMRDSDVILVNDPSCPRVRKLELSKQQKETLVAIKTVDKPNIHRLRELVYTTLPMVGFFPRIGELVFEKTHQVLKRPIKLSNNKDIQWHCMRSAAFNDWQGRLTVLAPEALRGSRSGLFGCFRFLSGRLSLHELQGKPSQEHYDKVCQALGPNGLLAKELATQGRSVLSPRALPYRRTLFWSLKGKKNRLLDNDGASTVDKEILRNLKQAFADVLDRFVVHTGEISSCPHISNASRRVLNRGDVLQILCYRPNIVAFHHPFLVQVGCMEPVGSWEATSGPSLWCVAKFVMLTPDTGNPQIFAAVLPCARPPRTEITSAATEHPGQTSQDARYENFHVISEDICQTSEVSRYEKYRVISHGGVSFAKLDESIRVVGVLHDCLELQCSSNLRGVSIQHRQNPAPLEGALFFALTRQNGYPPRMG